MVNTRRSETVSVGQRRGLCSATGKDSSDEESSAGAATSDGERSLSHDGEDSETWGPKWSGGSLTNSGVLNNRVRELRNRFVCTTQNHTFPRSVRRRLMRPIQSDKTTVLDHERNRRSDYPRRNMLEEEFDDLEDLEPDNSDFNLFTPVAQTGRTRSHGVTRSEPIVPRSRRHRQNDDFEQGEHIREGGKVGRPIVEPGIGGQLGSRGGLRPLKRECYADPNSPYSQDIGNSSDEKPDIEIRRSKRQRKFKYSTFNTSWITDHQMIRGYPKFKRSFISSHEEDSKESRLQEDVEEERSVEKQDDCNILDTPMNNIEITPKGGNTTGTVNKKFVFEYLRRNTSTRSLRHKNQVNGVSHSSRESDDNVAKADANNERILVNGEVTQESVTTNQSESQRANEQASNAQKKTAEEATGEPLNRSSRRGRRAVVRYTTTPETRRQDSDSTTEERHRSPKKYILRQRKPKPIQMERAEEERRERREVPRRRLRRTRKRRNKIASSDSDSSSSSDEDIPHSNKHRTGNSTMQLKPNRNRVNSPPRDKGKTKKDMVICPIDPLTLDSSITFASIGGLDEQVRCLREMVVLPMLYPEIFKQFHTNPPKGVLFHGPPGTGKTLMARALANECSIGNRKVAFFMRKGADLLSKWIGQTEKQMTLLFEQAAQMAPSIIFFDELDGLAPARTARQEQVHVSVVASLLALMDGLDKTRGEVIVVGATNRPDAIDPALRRPGRFDREIFFPLPSSVQRKEILKIVVSDWPDPPNNQLLTTLAERSAGYCGADLRALCTEAVLRSVRRTYPQIYESSFRLLIDPAKIKIEQCDFENAASALVPAGARGVPLHLGSNLPTFLEPLLLAFFNKTVETIVCSFPVADKNFAQNSLYLKGGCSARLLVVGSGSQYVAVSLLKHFEHLAIQTLDLASLHSTLAENPEQACIQILNEARRTSPSVIYLPQIETWWTTAGDTVKMLLQTIYSTIVMNSSSSQVTSIFLLATAESGLSDLSEDMTDLFSQYRNEVLVIDLPTDTDRENFFRPLIIDTTLDMPPPPLLLPITASVEPLPRAPTPPPPPLSPRTKQLLFEKEEETLIELRIFLRDVCQKLATNKAFFMFTKPVNLEEVPDYLDIVLHPMDLETMMTKVDLHRYTSAQEFLADVDLIQLNALTYNPDITPADKQIRHRACWFRDYAYALIKAEMDTDFEDNCRKIAKSRKDRQTGDPNEFLPPHIRALAEEDTPEVQSEEKVSTTQDVVAIKSATSITENTQANVKQANDSAFSVVRVSPHRKRRVPSWARGFLTVKKRRKICNRNQPEVKKILEVNNIADVPIPLNVTDDESKENIPELLPFEKCISPSSNSTNNTSKVENCSTIIISHEELDAVLARAVRDTEGCSVDILCDLYNQFKLIICKFSQIYDRQIIPQLLNEELDRFQKHYY